MGWATIEALSEDLRSHAGFCQAVCIHTNGILDFRHRQKGIVKLLGKEERYRAFNVLVGLCLIADLRGQVGLSFGAYYSQCTEHAGVSDRTARTVLHLAAHFNFVTVARCETDRRARLYVLTDRLRAYAMDWLAPTFDAFPALGRASPTRNDPYPAARSTFVSAMPDYMEGSLYFYARDADFRRIFAQIEGGSVTCMAIILAHVSGEDSPGHREIADRFGLSRPQVSRVVQEARRVGFIQEGPDLLPTDRLIELYLDCVALVLAFLMTHAPVPTHHRDDPPSDAI